MTRSYRKFLNRDSDGKWHGCSDCIFAVKSIKQGYKGQLEEGVLAKVEDHQAERLGLRITRFAPTICPCTLGHGVVRNLEMNEDDKEFQQNADIWHQTSSGQMLETQELTRDDGIGYKEETQYEESIGMCEECNQADTCEARTMGYQCPKASRGIKRKYYKVRRMLPTGFRWGKDKTGFKVICPDYAPDRWWQQELMRPMVCNDTSKLIQAAERLDELCKQGTGRLMVKIFAANVRKWFKHKNGEVVKRVVAIACPPTSHPIG